MYEACHQYFDEMDVVIAAAAVADYKPKLYTKNKKNDDFVIELEKTKDILASLGKIKKSVFNCLETENEIENAKGKIQKKT
jgi:phosphopantothenoylcysteine decarboxylase/phosphopantothenate--cysteine ligase